MDLYTENFYSKSSKSYFENICKKLYIFDEEIKNISVMINRCADEYNDGIRKIEEETKAALAEISSNITKVNAFLAIARSHTSGISQLSTPTPFDNGRLSRLAVQIDSSSANDPNAAALLREGTAQLTYLEKKRDLIQLEAEEKKLKHQNYCLNKQKSLEQKIAEIKKYAEAYLEDGDDVVEFRFLSRDNKRFFESDEEIDETLLKNKKISIGAAEYDVPFGDLISQIFFSKMYDDICDISKKKVQIPFDIEVSKGMVISSEYTNKNENEVLSGIRNFVLNIAKYKSDEFDRICFIDPVRLSPSALGCLAPLSEGKRSFIEAVPITGEEIKNRIKSIVDKEIEEERHSENQFKKKLYVFHNFPNGYDSDSVSKIQQLCANAEHYEAIVILTSNINERGTSSDALKYINSFATTIQSAGSIFAIKDGDRECTFKWYHEPGELPQNVINNLITNRPEEEDHSKDNIYSKRVNMSEPPNYKKGIRRIENIPYGINEETGELLTMSFEDSNFATFICGASRSGKSTLLHAIITGILKNNHPDDVEMWLIDFKMTEFSRYIEHMPPHIRYIILDESPELIYDIIDRLTEIMQKRQSVFMGNYEKLKDVPKEKYMPAMFIIIDEFSVMSNVMADSVSSGKDNYVIKMQTLLAKGAALGMHFIFASQGFTSGTRGLNDFAKKQVQQRIAMKTEFAEIRETLDLRNTSEKDSALMEQLEVYHTLTRIPADENGNHLQKANVLYINEDEEKEYIDSINTIVKAKPKYDAEDMEAYISKKPMVKDGDHYGAYISKHQTISEYIEKNNASNDESVYYMFIGDPQRMVDIHPVEIYNGFCENALIISPLKEKTFCSSMLLSAMRSLKMQDMQIECMTARKNSTYRQLKYECGFDFDSAAIDTWEICGRIRELKKAIMEKREDSKMILLLGFENILMDMSYSSEESNKGAEVNVSVNVSTLINSEFADAPLGEGEKDVLTLLAEEDFDFEDFDAEEDEEITNEVETIIETEEEKKEGIYDAKEDLKYILTHGPRLGYHFMMVFNTIGEFEQAKLSDSMFKHKIMFRISRSDAAGIVSSSCAGVVSELKDHIYRYTDGLEEISFRPYLHNGLTFDGWTLENGQVVRQAVEEEEYLM